MKKFFLTSTIFFLIATPIVAAAYSLQVKYPFISGVQPTTGLVDYIRYVYLFALGTVGLAAFGVMVYGGILYMMSGTNITSQNEAKAWFKAAISGLLLALASYLILNTINPNLVRIKAPELPTIMAPAGSRQLGESCYVDTECDNSKGLVCQGNVCTSVAPPSSLPIVPSTPASVPATPTTYTCSATCFSDMSIKATISNSPDCTLCSNDAIAECEKTCPTNCAFDNNCSSEIKP